VIPVTYYLQNCPKTSLPYQVVIVRSEAFFQKIWRTNLYYPILFPETILKYLRQLGETEVGSEIIENLWTAGTDEGLKWNLLPYINSVSR